MSSRRHSATKNPRATSQSRWATAESVAPWLITGLAFALRFYRLGREPLWFDEAYTALSVVKPPAAILSLLRGEGNAPLYYLLLHYWAACFGDGEYVLRLPSALCGAASIPLVYGVARRMFTRRAGLVAAALAAVSPLQVHYSQELRMYALLPPLALAVLYALYRLLAAPGWPAVASFALAATAGLYVHYYFFFLLPLAAAALLVPQRRRAMPFAAAGLALVLLGFAPWLPVFLHQAGGGVENWVAEWWKTRPFWYALPWSLESLGPGAIYPTMASFKFPSWWVGRVISLGLAALVIGGAAATLGRAWAARGAARATEGPEPAIALALTLAATLVPLVIAFAVSLLRTPIYVVARHDMIAWGAYYVLAGAVLSRLRPAVAIAATALWVTLAVAVLVPYFTTERPKRNYADLGDSIAPMLSAQTGAGDIVVFTAATRTMTQYYLRARPLPARLVSYPLENDTHLGWVDPRIQNDPAFAEAATQHFARWLQESGPLPAAVWVVGSTSRGTAPLLRELERLGYHPDRQRSNAVLLCLRRD